MVWGSILLSLSAPSQTLWHPPHISRCSEDLVLARLTTNNNWINTSVRRVERSRGSISTYHSWHLIPLLYILIINFSNYTYKCRHRGCLFQLSPLKCFCVGLPHTSFFDCSCVVSPLHRYSGLPRSRVAHFTCFLYPIF